MKKRACSLLICLGLIMILAKGEALAARAAKEETQAQGPPPALVVTAPITEGAVQPMQELIGTIYYVRVSRVAAEVAGLVEKVEIEAGERVKGGELLVGLSTDLLDLVLAGSRAEHDQVLSELEKATRDLARIKPLFQEASVAESVYEEYYYNEQKFSRKAGALKARVKRLELEKKKMSIVAPYDGLIVEKMVEKGEWVARGGTVAIVADDSEVEAVIEVPARLLPYLTRDHLFPVTAGGLRLEGRFVGFVPKGDEATRTFSVKLRMANSGNLVEGMEAGVLLPETASQNSLLVPRDAVVDMFGRSVIFVVVEDKARMVEVEIIGYSGMEAGVAGPGLMLDQPVVIKGNERLRDGQSVTPVD